MFLSWMAWRAFGQPLSERPDPPILIGDGSILLQIGRQAELNGLVWTRWTYHAPSGHEQEAMSWSAPGNGSIQEIKEKGSPSSGRSLRRLRDWGVLLVVRYTDGTSLQVRARDRNGKGLTIISSRPLREFRREGDRILRYGDSGGPHVSEAFVQTSTAQTPLCRDKKPGPCEIEIHYR